jgi:hypothetical protein
MVIRQYGIVSFYARQPTFYFMQELYDFLTFYLLDFIISVYNYMVK